MGAQIGFRVVKRRGIMRGHALFLHGLNEHRRVDIARVFFARGEDIRHQHLVGQIAAVDIILEQRLDAGIGVRLHDGEQTLMRLMDGVFQRAVHLSGVMAVIGIELHAADRAGVFKAAVRRGKARKRRGDGFGLCARFDARGHRRQRVHDVELARHEQVDMRKGLAFKAEVKRRAARVVIREVQRPPLIALAETVADRAAGLLGQQRRDARVVAVADACAAFGQQGAELGEGVGDIVDILIEIEVILFDVGDDGDGRVEVQKAGVELARFHDEGIVAADARAAADIIQLAADMHGGVKPRVQQHLGDHRCGGGFAVRAADVDGVAVALHQLPEQRGALHLGDAQFLGAHAFGVVFGDGGGIDDDVRAVHILRALADEHVNARLLQRVGHIGAGGIRTRDAHAELDQHAGQAAHRAAADADHVRAFARIIFDMRHKAPP